MTKNIFSVFIILFLCFTIKAFSQEFHQDFQDDFQKESQDYEIQRQKVNMLLDERSNKFGQYDESLRKKSGIFGMKSKADLRKSQDILLQIVEMDNKIFHETKNLLKYKDQMLSFEAFEKNKIQQLADDYDVRIDSYIKTISKLQSELHNLEAENSNLIRQSGLYKGLTFLLAFLILGFLIFKYFKKK